jgi:hypothetical protein
VNRILNPVNSPRFLSKKDFAAHRGVGKSAVSNWVKKGWVVEAEDPADGVIKVDVPRTEAKLNAYLDPARGRPKAADSQVQGELPIAAAPARTEPAGGSLADVRTDLIRQQTEKLQLENARRAGDLVPIEEFTRRAAEYARVSRERVIAIVRTQAEWLASAKDPRAIIAKLQDEIERGFADLADQIAAGELAEAADDDAEDDAAVAAEVTAALVEEEADEREVG